MRYYRKSNMISVSADEVRRLIAYKNDYHEAWFLGDIMAKHLQTEDNCWDGVSAGNDFDPNDTSDGEYGVFEQWSPFQIWNVTEQEAADIREFLAKHTTVESAIADSVSRNE